MLTEPLPLPPAGPPTEADIVDIKNVLRTLQEIVYVAGRDYVYEPKPVEDQGNQCVYVHNGEPDCLASRVLHRLGFPVESLAKWEGASIHAMTEVGRAKTPAGDRPLPQLSDMALHILYRAQRAQDSRQTWGMALDAARADARNNYGVTV